MTRSDLIRKYERFVFRGVPEQPESTYERDSFSHMDMRKTGLSIADDLVDTPLVSASLIGTFIIDLTTESESFIPSEPK